MEPAIAVKGLFKNYGKLRALAGVDLTVPAGRIYGILGPNGAGKSTLIKSLVGMIKASSGSVSVLGHEMPKEARAVRARLGYMPQIPALYGDLTVRANVSFFARAHKLEKVETKIDQALEFVGMSKRAEQKVEELSGGLKQRTSLACALVHDPELLILDEPTAGVDPILKEGFWKHFRELTQKGVTIIISTHLMDEPLACDTLGILREGRLVIEDTPANILASGKTTVAVKIGEETIHEKMENSPQALPRFLSRFGLLPEVKSISLNPESLEEIFLKLVNKGENRHE